MEGTGAEGGRCGDEAVRAGSWRRVWCMVLVQNHNALRETWLPSRRR